MENEFIIKDDEAGRLHFHPVSAVDIAALVTISSSGLIEVSYKEQKEQMFVEDGVLTYTGSTEHLLAGIYGALKAIANQDVEDFKEVVFKKGCE